MNPVIVRKLRIGEGIPKICVPIVGTKVEEILKQADSLRHLPADIVEWRADWYEDIFDHEKVKHVLASLRNILGEIPILFTFRTKAEGGEKTIDAEAYRELNQMVAQTGVVDMVDVELFLGEKVVQAVITCAHEHGVCVVASNHDFDKTPSQEEIVHRLQQMQDMEADILKIAVMPQCAKDVITLLAATEEMVSKYARQPVVTMSMSGQGVVSRVAGETFGSAITFGAAERSSAPGQISAERLKVFLEAFHQVS